MLLDKTNIDSATRIAGFSEKVTYLRAMTENSDMDDRFFGLESTNETKEDLSTLYEEVMSENIDKYTSESTDDDLDELIIGNYHSSDEVDKMLGLTNNQVAAYETAFELQVITEGGDPNISDVKDKVRSFKTNFKGKMSEIKSLIKDGKYLQARREISTAKRELDRLAGLVNSIKTVSTEIYILMTGLNTFVATYVVDTITDAMLSGNDAKSRIKSIPSNLINGSRISNSADKAWKNMAFGGITKSAAKTIDDKTGTNLELLFDKKKHDLVKTIKSLNNKLTKLEAKLNKTEIKTKDANRNGIPDKQEATKESVDIGSLMETYEEMFPVTEKTNESIAIHESLDVDDNTKAMLESAYTNWKNAEAKLEDSRYDLNPTVRSLAEKKAARLGNEYKAMCEKATSKE